MPVSSISWGPTYENTLTLSTSLLDILTDREPRAGSEWVQAPSGVEDAWVTGFDYVLECRAAFIPDGGSSPTPVSGSVNWQAFLDFCRQKNPFRFVPDVTAPLFYVDGCYLVSPTAGFGSLGSDIKRQVTIKIRNPSVDFHRALRGLMFEYAPGGDITQPIAATFARSTIAAYHGVDGLVHFAGINVLRDRHYIGGKRTRLHEPGATNWRLQSQALGTTWGGAQLTKTNNAAVAPDGTTTATSLIPPAVSGVEHYAQQLVTITSGENLAFSGYFKASGYNAISVRIGDGANTNSVRVIFDLVNGAIGNTGVSGAGVLVGKKIVPLGNGWYQVWVWGTVNAGVVSAGPVIKVFDTIAHANAENNVWTPDGVSGVLAWGCQLERNGTTAVLPPTSYIATAAGTAARTADGFTWPWPYAPQAQWVYVKFIESGAIGMVSGVPRVLEISNFGSNPRLFIYQAGGKYSFALISAAGVQYSPAAAAAPNVGDTVELLGLYDGVSTITLIQAINGAAGVSASAAAAPPGAAAWGTAAIGLFCAGDASSPTPGAELVVKAGPGTAIATIPAAAAA